MLRTLTWCPSNKISRHVDAGTLNSLKVKAEIFVNGMSHDVTVGVFPSAQTLFLNVFVAAQEREARKVTEKTIVKPVSIPTYMFQHVPAGEDTQDRLSEGDKFKARAYYQPYRKGLFPVASFDAESTEYRLAEMMGSAKSVTWWKRLYQTENYDRAARFAVDTKGKFYYPDFVVFEESTNTYYVVEGKSSRDIYSTDVQDKAQAALDALAEVPTIEKFAGQRWKYLLVDEKMIDASNLDWDALVAAHARWQ